MSRARKQSESAVPSSAQPAPAAEAPPGLLAWLTHLVHLHRARLIRVVRREGLQAEDAFDCVQETFTSFLVLRLLDEVHGEDVARLLGMTPGNVAVLLHRAKGNLRTCMASAGYRESLPASPGKVKP